MSAISVTREGEGPEILLIHGGASPDATWGAIAPLAARWTLAIVHRRGYPPSPSLDGRQDFAVDAADVFPLLGSRPHVVAHSYGVLGTLIAAAMERAHSLTLDPHKWLGVPVDAGCALVRRADDLRDAFSVVPPYLRQDAGTEVGTFAEYGLEQTRPFRALKTWATIAARRRDGIVDQVVRANALARQLAALVEREPSLVLAATPETSIVAFRARPPGCASDRIEAVNRALPEAVQARGRAFVTGTVYEGHETVRACILHPGTTEGDLATLVSEVVAVARELAARAARRRRRGVGEVARADRRAALPPRRSALGSRC